MERLSPSLEIDCHEQGVSARPQAPARPLPLAGLPEVRSGPVVGVWAVNKRKIIIGNLTLHRFMTHETTAAEIATLGITINEGREYMLGGRKLSNGFWIAVDRIGTKHVLPHDAFVYLPEEAS